MSSFKFQEQDIKGLILISPFCVYDSRGCFSKPFEKSVFAAHGIDLNPWEELRSYSRKGVLRGLHFQRKHSQDKLVQVLYGAVYDVVVDMRKGSATFGQWRGFNLTAESRQLLYIPKGFAHGFLSLSENTLFSYLCGDRYDSESDRGIRWNDPQLAIDWPLEQISHPILSEKDVKLPTLDSFLSEYGSLEYLE